MRNLTILLLALLSTIGVWAQANDTAALRKNKVAAMYKYQYVHAFDKTKDTCLYEVTKYDEDMLNVYHSVEYGCIGYKGNGYSTMSYENGKIKTVNTYQNNEKWSVTSYTYDGDEERPEKVKIFFYQTNDSAEKVHPYFFNKKGRLDSTLTEETRQDGSTNVSWTFARYNKKDQLVQLFTTDSNYVPLNAMTYELDKKGKVESMAYQTYGDKANFTQTFYEYNQLGQLAATANQSEQRQVYFYKENGLLNNMYSYNPEGVLEVEYIYKYDYREE